MNFSFAVLIVVKCPWERYIDNLAILNLNRIEGCKAYITLKSQMNSLFPVFNFGKQYCSVINAAIFILCVAVIFLEMFSPSTTGGGTMLPYPVHLSSRSVEVAYCDLFVLHWLYIFIFHHTAVPTLVKVQSKMQTLPSPQWAHLDNEEFQKIVSYSVQDPHLLFIRQYKFNDM